MKNVPSSVRVGPIDYEVIVIPNLSTSDRGVSLDGQIKYATCKISLDEGLVDQMRVQVLWHEILHAILNQASLDLGRDQEKVCDVVAYGVVQVLMDNPELRG